MSDGPRYHLRRGRMPRLVDEVATAPARSRVATGGPWSGAAAGSAPNLRPPTLELDELGELGELGDLAAPALPPGGRITFGDIDIAIEHHADGVSLVLPGMIRLTGSPAEAAALIALLRR